MEARDSFCFPKKTKNPNPSPIGKKFGFCCCGAMEGTRTRPTDSQEPNGTFCPFHHLTVNRYFNRITVILLLLFYCILCIACTSLHLLSILAMCKKCTKVCRAKISPAKQAVSHSPKSWISTVFITHNLPVLSRQQSYITHRFYGRVQDIRTDTN